MSNTQWYVMVMIAWCVFSFFLWGLVGQSAWYVMAYMQFPTWLIWSILFGMSPLVYWGSKILTREFVAWLTS